jgi:hypothetical protein
MILTLMGTPFAPLAFARVVRNTIDPVANLADNGRHLLVTGPIAGDVAGELVHIQVTVTQRTTGAVAKGQTFLTLTGAGLDAPQQWQIQASIHGNEVFAEGPAIAVAIATTSNRGITTDAHQWLVEVTLVRP